jgi:hypothetical protein
MIIKTDEDLQKAYLDFWNMHSMEVIAFYHKNKNGTGGAFRKLQNPLTGLNLKNIEPDTPLEILTHFNLIDGHQYQIKCLPDNLSNRLQENRPYKLILDDTYSIKKIDYNAKELVQKWAHQYESVEGIAAEALEGLLQVATNDVDKLPETFLYELLQNADDYPPEHKPQEVHIHYTENYLLFCHNGVQFSPANAYAICSVNAGDKRMDMDKTGFKGIGFKSLFTKADLIYIKSGEFTFRFDKEYHIKQHRTAWQLIPVWSESIPAGNLFSSDLFQQPVCVLMRIIPEWQELVKIALQNFSSEKRLLLFLRNVTKISTSINHEISTLELNSEYWNRSIQYKFEIPDEIKQGLILESKQNPGRVPEKLLFATNATIQFAGFKFNGLSIPVNDAQLFVYLPTAQKLGLPFLLNGDFIPDSSRQKIYGTSKWNQYLMERSGYHLIAWLKENYERRRDKHFLQLIPDIVSNAGITLDDDKKALLQHFYDGMKNGLADIAFLPTRSGEMKRISEVIIDTVGILDCFEKNELNQLYPNNANFVHPDIQHLHKLIALIDAGLAKTTYYTIVNYSPFLYQPFFQNWLKNIDNHKRFHSVFKEKGLHDSLLTATVFLRKDGRMSKKDELYLSLGYHEERLKWLDIKTIHPELREFYPAIGYTFLKWDHVSFLHDQLSDKILALNEHLRYGPTNKNFFEFLAYEIDQIPAKYFSIGTISIRNCWMFLLGSKTLVNTVDSGKITSIYSDQFKELFKFEILPSLGFVMLEEFYCSLHPDNTQNQKLFNQLGISSLNNERMSKIIIEKLIYHQNAINGKLRNVTILSTKIKVAQALWNLISFHWMHLTREEKEKLKPQIKNFLVLADNGVWMPLGEIYLGGPFTEDNTINILAQQFTELQLRFLSHHLISEQYNAAFWKERFEKLPIKKSIYTLLERDVWPRINTIPTDKLPAITYQLLKYADKLIQAGIKLNEIPLLNAKAEKSNEVFYIGKEFLEENYEDNIFPQIQILNKVSGKYLEYGTKKEWIEFLQLIDRERISSLKDAAIGKLSEYIHIPGSEFDFETNKDVLISLNKNKDKDILEQVQNLKSQLPVLTSKGIKAAGSCYLSSAYEPKINLQRLAKVDTIDFISETYLEDKRLTLEEWKNLFIHLGVKESIDIEWHKSISRNRIPVLFSNAIDIGNSTIKNEAIRSGGKGHSMVPFVSCRYIEAITEPEVNRQFWKHIIQQKELPELLQTGITYKFATNSFSFINFVHWYLKCFPSVLNDTGQVVIPNQLYRYGLKDPIMDKSYFPEIDLNGIQIGETTLEHFLGFKMEPDFYYVLQQLLGKANVVRNNELWTVFKSGMDRRNKWNADEQAAWNSFCQMDTAPNRFGKWVPKSELFFLSTGLKTDIVANHPGVIFSKLIPYSEDLGISELSQNAFSLNLPEPKSDNSFKDVLKARLPYFAFFATGGDENWPQYFEKLEASINEIKCTEVKRIEWVCDLVDPKIAYSEEHYIFHEGVHYHVGRWNSMRASPFQKAMYALFQFEGTPLRFEYYCDFLEWTINEIIAFLQEAGYTVPKEWIKEKEADKNIEEASKEPDKPTIQSQSQNGSSSANTANGTSAQKPEQKHFEVTAESELTTAEVAEIKALLGQSLSDDDKENAWLIAFFRAIKWYKERGFDTSEPEGDYASAKKNKNMVVTAPDEEKSMHRILVRSARNGILRLKYIAWFDLLDSNTELFVLTGNKPGEHKIFKTQKELLQSNKDSIITKLDAANKYEELESLLNGEYKEDRKKFSEFSLMFRMEGFTGFKSIFESIYQKEGSNDINEDDLDIG